MKFLEKKIYGFTILEIGIGAFLLMNIKTIGNIFGLVSKPITNAVDSAVDIQVQNTLGLTKSQMDYCKELAPQIKVHLDAFNTNEKSLCKLLGDSVTTLLYWQIIQKYYNQVHTIDLKSELYSTLNSADDYWFDKDDYKTLLKRPFLIADLIQ